MYTKLEIQFYTNMKIKVIVCGQNVIIIIIYIYIWFGVTLVLNIYVSWEIFIKFKDKDASDTSLVSFISSSGGFDVFCFLIHINSTVMHTGNANPRRKAATALSTCSVIWDRSKDFSPETKRQSKSVEFSHNLPLCSNKLFMPLWVTYHSWSSISHQCLSVQSHR